MCKGAPLSLRDEMYTFILHLRKNARIIQSIMTLESHAMLQQLIEFVSHHWLLVGACVLLLLLILLNEFINHTSGLKKLSATAAVLEMNHRDALVIDLRPKIAFQQEHILGAVSIPSDDPAKFKRYQSVPIILVCERGLQSATLASKLIQQGFKHTMVLDGGINAWQAANLPLVKNKK